MRESYSITEIHENLTGVSVDLHYLYWDTTRELQMTRSENFDLTPLEVIIQLRQIGEVYASRVKRIVDRQEDEPLPFMHEFDENKQLNSVDIEAENVKYNLGKFIEARSNLINKISFLDEVEWDSLKGNHEKEGEISLKELLTPLVSREKKAISDLKTMIGISL